MDGFDEIYDFGERWKGSSNFIVTPIGNYIFRATVTYDSPNYGIEVESCTVQIYRNGGPDGNVEIYESGVLTNETHHLGFHIRWQKYKFDPRNGAFVIVGEKAPKMGGHYKVTLVPNGGEPSFS